MNTPAGHHDSFMTPEAPLVPWMEQGGFLSRKKSEKIDLMGLTTHKALS